MAQAVSNLSISTHLWADLVDHLNIVCHALTNNILTSAANTAGGSTSGNASLVGIFGANTLAAGSALRGGTVDAAANLSITSNVSTTGTFFNSSANVTLSGANTVISSANISISGIANFSGNVFVSAISTFSANTIPSANGIQLGSATRRWQCFANNVDTINFSANSVVGNTISIANTADFVSSSNTNLGAVATNVLLQLPMSTYRAAKISISANTPAGEFEYTETNLLHNGTDAFYTTSVVYSNSQFFTVDSVVNGANVDVRITPSVANVAVKVIGQLIKV